MVRRLWLVCASVLAIVSFAVSAAGITKAEARGVAGLDACLPLPVVPIFTAPAVVCPVSTHNHAAVANVQPGVTYTWTVAGGNATITSPSTGTAIDFDARTAGTIEFNVTATSSCGPTSGSLRVAIDEPSPVTIMGAPAACANATDNQLAVVARPGETFLWTIQNGTITSGATSSSITYTAGSSGLVTISVRRTSACGVVSNGATEVAIDAPLLPRIFATLPGTFLAETDSVCAGETVNVFGPDFGPDASYAWTITNASNVTTDGRNASFAAGPGGTTDISLAVTLCGVSGTATWSMAVNQPPALDIISPSSACPTATNGAFVKPLPGATYTWQIANGTIAGSNSSPFILYDTGAAGDVTLTLTETRCGFSSTQTKVVPIDDEIDVPLIVGRPDAQSVCPGAPAQAGLTVTGVGETYSWSVTNGQIISPANGTSITFLAPTSGSVTVTANVSRCGTTSSKSITLPVTSPPAATITAPAVACGQGLTASVPPVEGGYHWTIVNGTITAGEYERTVTFTPGPSGNVTLNVLVGSMCGRFAASTVNIPIGPQPVTITGPDATCPSGSVELDAGPGFASYLWSTGATTRKITVAPADTTQYTVTALTAGGCPSSDKHTVTVHVTPAVTITGPDATCPSGTVSLDAGPGFAAYQWSTGATTRQITVHLASTTTYEVTVTDVNGCQGTGSHTVAVTPGPDASITTVPDSLICPGRRVIARITAQPGTILWTVTNGTIVLGQGTPIIAFDAGASGTVGITATVTTSSCTASGSKSIAIATPEVSVSGPDRTCFGTPVTLDAGPGFNSYLWTFTDARGVRTAFAPAQQVTVLPGATTTYEVWVTNAAGCSAMATKTIVVDPKPMITADTVATPATLTASPGLLYRWSTGATTRSIAVTSAGTYGVSVVSTDGCDVAADPMFVEFVPTGSYRATAGSLELNLPNVTLPGSIAIAPIDPLSAGPLPDGYDPSPVPLAYEIRTSALYTAPLQVAFLIAPPPANPTLRTETRSAGVSNISAGQFAALRILHGENGVLVDRTVSSDYATGTIEAEVGSLGPFVLARTTAPALGGISGPAAPVAKPASATVTASFSSPAAPNRVSVDWGDGSASAAAVTEANGEGSAAASHVYAAAGVYPVTMTLVNAAGASTSRTFQYIVVYDPNGGFVTGGGTIQSPAGAMPRKPGAQGKASFGFVSRYQRGANVPTGSTELNFSAGAFNFRSTRYDWLVIAGARAQYKGSGTVNGDGDYGFLLTAIDGQMPGGGGTDRFRLKVWDTTSGGIVYDNQIGANDNADPSTALHGGSIVIHP